LLHVAWFLGSMFMAAFTSSHCWRKTTILVRRACIFCSSSARFASRVSCLLVAQQLNRLIFGPLICSVVMACPLVSLAVACVDWLVLRYNELLRGLQYCVCRNMRVFEDAQVSFIRLIHDWRMLGCGCTLTITFSYKAPLI